MKYLVKNKDKNLIEFEVDIKEFNDIGGKNFIQFLKNAEILDDAYLPKTINKKDLLNSLKKWINTRKIPSNRQFAEKIIASYSSNQNYFMDYIDVSLGLSLNDTFWIVPENKNYKWADLNLYNNNFDEALKLVAFMGNSYKISGITSSPEYTTNGMLKKCWHKENGKIYLYKGSSATYANSGKEAYGEYYMSQIAKAMGLSCIEYDLKNFHNQIVSSCEIFTNEKEGYLPMQYCLDLSKITDENRTAP